MSIYINLNDEETAALEGEAKANRRTPNQHAAWLVVTQLKQHKLVAEMIQKAESAGINHSQYTYPSDLDLQGQAIPVLKGGED